MTRLIATFFYIGRLPWVPGTWGSLAALPLAYALHRYCGFPAFALATVLVFLINYVTLDTIYLYKEIGHTVHTLGLAKR